MVLTFSETNSSAFQIFQIKTPKQESEKRKKCVKTKESIRSKAVAVQVLLYFSKSSLMRSSVCSGVLRGVSMIFIVAPRKKKFSKYSVCETHHCISRKLKTFPLGNKSIPTDFIFYNKFFPNLSAKIFKRNAIMFCWLFPKAKV